VAHSGRIYVDLDDVLSQTIRGLTRLLERHCGRRVDADAVEHFDLARSFDLDAEELRTFMQLAHRPEELDGLEPIPGGARVLASWVERGYAVSVMTGRPPACEPVSRRWLERHEIPHHELQCVDKYAQRQWAGGDRGVSLDELMEREFRLAIEDSLDVAVHLVERCRVRVALLDRPWNRDTSGLTPTTAAAIVRCQSWEDVAARFPAP